MRVQYQVEEARTHQGVPSNPRSVRGSLSGSKKTARPKSAVRACSGEVHVSETLRVSCHGWPKQPTW